MKRFICIILCLSVLFGVRFSAHATGLENFIKTREYNQSFSDVSLTDWFYQAVKSAYETGITDGYSESEFAPYELISQAQAITFAAKISAVYEKSEIRAKTDSEAWYAPYVEYALKTGIAEDGVFSEKNLNKPATRGQVAYLLARSINFTDLKNINTHIATLPDVSAYDDFYNEIIMLYRAGVVAGKDKKGSFYADEYINRSEVAAMIARITDKTLRLNVVFEAPDEQENKYDAVAIADIASPAVFYVEVYNSRGAASKSGSGFFISADGIAVTNYHVIEGGYSAKIRLPDSTVLDVESVLGYDKDRDIAILKIAGSGFKYLEIGDSSAVSAGQDIFCIGSPLGLENTISTGVISNVNRIEDGYSYIQISAPISSGSSGGAVLDDNCRVIGISSAGYNQGQNLNLAIPINDLAGVPRDKNITLYELTTGRKPTQNNQSGQTASGVGNSYADNKYIPDFGKMNFHTETKPAEYSNGIVTRFYIAPVESVNNYIKVLSANGFYRQRNIQSGGKATMVFASRNTAVLVEYDSRTLSTMISYYYE